MDRPMAGLSGIPRLVTKLPSKPRSEASFTTQGTSRGGWKAA